MSAAQNHFPKPRIFISRCIEFDACRWNGAMIGCDFVRALKPFIEPVTRCPEAEIGLGVPRNPVRIVRHQGRLELYQIASGKFYTDSMLAYCSAQIPELGELDGAIFKEKSPSCGDREVKIYASADPLAAQNGKGRGFWADALISAYPDIPEENEGRLNNFTIREHFYTAIFTRSAFRETKNLGTMKALVEFHSRNKLLFMAYNQAVMRDLGRLVANHEGRPIPDLFALYQSQLPRIFQKIPRRGSMVNVLLHAFGYFSDQLEGRERAHFLELLESYQSGRIPLSACQSILQSWIERFDQAYLRSQSFFQPYPPELIDITDSGKGVGSQWNTKQ
ncbi:MAG: YbgA family protein [Spirochaetota bacterium]